MRTPEIKFADRAAKPRAQLNRVCGPVKYTSTDSTGPTIAHSPVISIHPVERGDVVRSLLLVFALFSPQAKTLSKEQDEVLQTEANVEEERLAKKGRTRSSER